MGKEKVICLACVSSETHNLQRVFRPRGVLPFIGYIGMCGASRGISFDHFGLKQGMVWVCFLEEATSSSFGDKTISPLMFTPTVYVP